MITCPGWWRIVGKKENEHEMALDLDISGEWVLHEKRHFDIFRLDFLCLNRYLGPLGFSRNMKCTNPKADMKRCLNVKNILSKKYVVQPVQGLQFTSIWLLRPKNSRMGSWCTRQSAPLSHQIVDTCRQQSPVQLCCIKTWGLDLQSKCARKSAFKYSLYHSINPWCFRWPAPPFSGLQCFQWRQHLEATVTLIWELLIWLEGYPRHIPKRNTGSWPHRAMFDRSIRRGRESVTNAGWWKKYALPRIVYIIYVCVYNI